MQNLFLVSLALSTLALAVQGQSCGVVGTNETTLVFEALTESTPGNTLISRFEIENVESSTAQSSPHYRYIRALRYANGVYELWTEAVFPEFVATERSLEVERVVTFRCTDGSSSVYTFIVPVIDENNNAPSINGPFEISVELPRPPSGIARTPIVITDADVNPSNNDVHVTSSNRKFAPVVTRTSNYPDVATYQLSLQLDSSITEGEYSTIITADDGANPVAKVIDIIVLPAGTPATEGTIVTSTEGPVEEVTTMV